MKKLTSTHLHIMNLINRDADENGYTKVSEVLYKTLSESMPKELITFEKLEEGGRAKLTKEGINVLNATKWL